MRLTSMDILLHRYFDGDLSPEESEAFLRDVAADPLLAARVDAEGQLDMALIDDIYSIDPPAHLRQVVLDAVLATPASTAAWDVWLRAAAAAVFVVLAFTIPTAVTVIPVAVPQEDVIPPSANGTATIALPSHRPVARMDAPVMSVVDPRPLVEEQLHNAVPPELSANTNISFSMPDPGSSVHNDRNVEHEQPMLVEPTPRLFAGVRGLASLDVMAVRANVVMAENAVVFAEVGRTILAPTRTIFQDGIAQSEATTTQRAYVAVGAAVGFPLPELRDQNITLSAALGVSQMGPMAMADVTIDVVNIRGLVLQAGAQWTGHIPMDTEGTALPMRVLPVIAVQLNF